MKSPISKRLSLVTSALLAAGAITGGVVALRGTNTTVPHHPGGNNTTQAPPDTVDTSNTTTLTANNSGNQPDNSPAAPVSAACKALPLDTAAALLGQDTKNMPAGSTTAFKATDTTVSACAYVNGASSAQLVTREPQNALGVSRNAVVFGSGKPADAVTVSGYGQAAYWDPRAKRLNILANNTWYAITRSSGSQSDAEAVAKVLVGL